MAVLSGPLFYSSFSLIFLIHQILEILCHPLITFSSIFSIASLNPSNLLHILLMCVDNITCMSHSFPPTRPTMYSSQSILCVPPLLLFSFSLSTPALPVSTTTFSLMLSFHVLQQLSVLMSTHLEAPSKCCPSTSLKPPLTLVSSPSSS